MSVSEMMMAEWRALWRDRRLMAILLLVPLGYLVLFGFLYSEHKVRHLPVIYADEDNSPLSREILQAFSASDAFELLGPASSEEDLLDQIQQGRAAVGVVIPPDLSENVKRGKQGQVMAVIDGSNMIIANTAFQNASEIVQTFSGGISIRRMEADVHPPDYGNALRLGYRMLFNPTLNYSDFLLLGLAGTVLQQVILLGISLCVTRDKERGTWSRYLVLWRTPWKIFLAKTLPYFLIGLFDVVCVVGVVSRGFGLPFLGSVTVFLVLSILFVATVVSLGFAASLFSPNQLQATQVSMLVAVPSFLLSGFTWPFLAMPGWVAALGHCLPLTYFVHGLREVAIKGNGWQTVAPDLRVLGAMTGLLILVSLIGLAVQGRGAARAVENGESVRA